MKYVLLVTWFAYGQPPNSYQVVLNSAQACAKAQMAVQFEAKRLLDEVKERVAAAASRGQYLPASASAPTVSTACTPQD